MDPTTSEQPEGLSDMLTPRPQPTPNDFGPRSDNSNLYKEAQFKDQFFCFHI